MNDIQRAIDQLNDLFDHCNSMIEEPESIWREDCDAIKTAISAMQELQQYRQTGASPERCKELICERSAAKRILGHYEAIGTLEECREAMERQIPMKVTDIHVDEYCCPARGAENNCNQGKIGDKYCPECGQAIVQEENDDQNRDITDC